MAVETMTCMHCLAERAVFDLFDGTAACAN